MKVSWIARRTDERLVKQFCPPRKADTHKGDYGRILLLCGAEGYTGAPALAAKGALRAGAGLIFVGVPRSVYPIVASKLDAPMVFPLPDGDGKLCLDALPMILERLATADACLIGPGLGQNRQLEQLLPKIVRNCTCPLVLDADGINILSRHKDVLRGAGCPLILTPHEGEFRRLSQRPENDRVEGTVALARELGAVILRKGHETVISDGRKTYVNRTGNPGMATGGSGDVLAGILTALLGQRIPPLEAAATGAWLHGTAGDLASERLGQYGTGPSDLLEELPRLLP